jgi:hypothetical protein
VTAPLKADVTAADRLLKAAVRRAVEMLQQPARVLYIPDTTPMPTRNWTGTIILSLPDRPQPDPVVAMLTAAGECAALLLGEARDA